MVFLRDQGELVINLLESNIEQKIIIKYGMKYRCTDLITDMFGVYNHKKNFINSCL